jgi:hypothetical protein
MKQGLRQQVGDSPSPSRRSHADRPGRPDVTALLHLQRTAGNKAVTAALQGLGFVGLPLPVQRAGEKGAKAKSRPKTKKERERAEALRKKKEREEAAQLKKTKQEEAGKKAQEVEAAKKAKEKEVVPTPSAEETESEVPKVRDPKPQQKNYEGLTKEFHSKVRKWRASYMVSLGSSTLAGAVKKDLDVIIDLREKLRNLTNYISSQADTAKTAIKDGDKDAAKRDSWLDLEKECNEAESELDDTVEQLQDAMKPALKAEQDRQTIITLRSYWATWKTGIEHRKHMTDTGLTELAYLEAAKKLAIDKTPSGTQDILSGQSRKASDKTVFFDPGNGFFAVLTPEGIISMFKPRDGRGYYNRQVVVGA